MNPKREEEKFWKVKSEELGAPIRFRSYARFLGMRGTGVEPQIRNLSGLLYATEDRLYFEDFERHSLMDALFQGRKREYEKFSIDFDRRDLGGLRQVTEKGAEAYLKGRAAAVSRRSLWHRLFGRPVWELNLRQDVRLFFEIMEPEGLITLVNGPDDPRGMGVYG